MKIAFVYDVVYPWIKGGVEKRIYEIGKRLVERGHEVHWYGIGWWLNDKNEKVIDYNGITIHSVCSPMEIYVDGRRSIKEAIYFASYLFPHLMRNNFDIIDCQEFPYFPCFISKVHSLIRKSNLVITWHEVWDDYWFEYLGKKGVFGWMIERLTSRLTTNNIAVSKKTKKDLENIGCKNVEVISNGIDFKKISKIQPAKEESDVIFVGRLIKEKNVDILIKSISILKEDFPDIKCLIIGDGPEREYLISLSKKLNVENNMRFLGFLKDHDDVIAYMKSSKIFVLPSRREGFGIVALEANACSLPVITVRHERNAAVELIKDEYNGYVCNLSEVEIAEKIMLALSKRKKMKNYCIEFSKKYDWDRIVDEIERFYGGIV